jgi:two-component system nitrate/nitrite response regulator NarL
MKSRPSPGILTEAPLRLSQRPVRVLIALGSPMDCQLFLTASKRARPQLSVVGCAVSRDNILKCFSRGNIDVALINADLEDGRLAGLEFLPEILTMYQETRVVMLFDTWQDELILQAFRAGAKGVFCRAEKKLDMLWKCIAAVHQGQVWANSGQLHLLLDTLKQVTPIRAGSSMGISLLASRETEVANLVAIGLPNKEIAVKLGITEHTVSNYLFRIYNKLGISSRVELVLYVMKRREEHRATG